MGIAIALQHCASIGALCGEAHNAARLVGYANAQYKELGSEREYTEKWSYDRLVAALREQLSDAEREKLVAESAVRSDDEAIEAALKV